MSRPLVSVVFATYQRAHLLERSLICYENQEFDNDRLELICVDDHSTDDTRDLVLDFSRRTGIRTVVVTDAPKPQSWRDCAATLNLGIRASTGEHVLLTHPECMPGRRSVAACVEQLRAFENKREFYLSPHYNPLASAGGCEMGLYACCKVYYLSPREQELIDTCPWREEGALAVRKISGFYEEDVGGHPDFCHRATDRIATPGYRMPVWESFVFGGHSRQTWKRLGGMLETQQWGSVDVAWMERRRTLGILNHTCPTDDTIVVHQNHSGPNDTPTDRDMDKWVEELRSYNLRDHSKLVYPTVDYL